MKNNPCTIKDTKKKEREKGKDGLFGEVEAEEEWSCVVIRKSENK